MRRTPAIILAAMLIAMPTFGTKKPKQQPSLTQPDIVRGCLTVREIIARSSGLFTPAVLSGIIANGCQRELYVSIAVVFFDANGNEMDTQIVDKLIPDGDSQLRVVCGVSRTATGRITSVFVRP